MKKETRNSEGFSLIDGDSRKVEGYAIVFNRESRNLGGFTEIISPNALDGVLEKSTILALMNHDESRGVLARNVRGNGSLSLEVDDIGLRYSFEAPRTALGDELIEGLRRGDINTSSFAFCVRKEDVTWSDYREDGTRLRTINKFDEIFDVSPVYREAYEDTSVALRSLEEQKEKEEDEPIKEDTEETKDETPVEEEKVDAPEKEDTADKEEEKPQEEDKENNNCKNENTTRKMEKFSIVKAIRSVVDNTQQTEANAAVMAEGRRQMRGAGVSFGGQIQLPMSEYRDGEAADPNPIQEAVGLGAEVVATEKYSLMGPLTNALVFNELGATFLNVTNNISVPKMSALQSGWAGEIEAATQTEASFETVDYQPLRISSFIDISKTLLYQDGTGVEEMVRQQIIESLAQTLESTILGSANSTSKKPKGIFYGADAPTLTYAGLVDMEKTVEDANVGDNLKYVVNPTIKATLRQTTVGGTKSDFRFLYENGEIDGIPAVVTSNCSGIALADWSNLWVVTFGGADVVVDTVTQATRNCVRIVVSMNVDAKFVRDEAVVAKLPA